ncbi:phosphoenolpyruvate/phosphate translocator, putative [Plasmodium gallinaceum]|uniref:Phosphoenolpyruvate/phosphate translocator, putative n=1 Tax=Plasmodium gallinaceum TaxID=5849 RepID=A0A1J1GVU8_PLAGA|nr:phosphoenolpyruvate/phosphate translocator, putative [Plasmodium gallinaceum]CRG96563.1 phosphoenolpyruvate/phosphate translocator, putative [Plasmodium gallinaceum]
MNIFYKALIIIAIKIPIYLGRNLSNGNKYYVQNTPINVEYKNTFSNIKRIKPNKKFESKNNLNKTLFLYNYQVKYGKIKNSGQVNLKIVNAHKINLKKDKNLFNNISNNAKFALFNSIKDDITSFEDDIGDNGIIDDISSSNDNFPNTQNEVVNTGTSENNDNLNVNMIEKKRCSFLNKLVEGGKTISLLSLWYVCNIFYNIENKKALNILNLPITIAITQIFVGLPIFLIPWLLKIRKRPELFYDNEELKNINVSDRNVIVKALQKYKLFLKKYKSIIKQSIYHGYVHLLSVIAMGAGAISFVHIVKALEPLFAAFFSFFLMNNRMSFYTYSSLIPIVFGVSLASIKELSFTYKALYSTLAANVFSTMRAIEAKIMMGKNLEKLGKNLTPGNIFALLTIFSAVFLTPALFLDAFKWKDAYYYLINNNANVKILARHVLMSGLWFYLYNELSFMALHRLNHISHAVASTVKRVFLILTSYFIFGTKFSFMGGLGSSIAVTGTLLYSLAKQKFG